MPVRDELYIVLVARLECIGDRIRGVRFMRTLSDIILSPIFSVSSKKESMSEIPKMSVILISLCRISSRK
jgi:hypothetical protein